MPSPLHNSECHILGLTSVAVPMGTADLIAIVPYLCQ